MLTVWAGCSAPGPAFTDAGAATGIDFLHSTTPGALIHLGGGVVVLDYDGDGLDDVYLPNSHGPNALYRNDGGGTFTEVAAEAGVVDRDGIGSGGCAADYDNDGDQDLFLANYGPSVLFRNDGNGAFSDVTDGSGLDDDDADYRSLGCTWGDYDRDGLLDLVVVRHLDEDVPFLFEMRNYIPAVRGLGLYRNVDGGVFSNVTRLLGDTPGRFTAERERFFGSVRSTGFQPGWVDYDNDGDPDLYVVNDFGGNINPNVLWRNDGPGADGSWRFLDVSKESRTDVSIFGMGLAVGDYNLDGHLDLYATNINDNVLLKSDGDGLAFTDATTRARARGGKVDRDRDRYSWGAMFMDYDNDGDEDLYVVSGHLEGQEHNPLEQPNILLRNDGGRFKDVSEGSGADDPGIGRGGAFLDLDGDGCLDIVVGNVGQRVSVLRNLCHPSNGWLIVETVGTVGNRDGIGARITLVAEGKTQIREISSGSNSAGQNMRAAHFGLGSAVVVDSLTIRWPSGRVQTLLDIAPNRRITVTEPLP